MRHNGKRRHENGKFFSYPAFADNNNILPYRKVPTSLLSRKVCIYIYIYSTH